MKTLLPWSTTVALASVLFGCSSTPAPTTSDAPAGSSSGDAAASQMPMASGGATTGTSATPVDAPTSAPAAGPKEATKDANALVLELTVESSKGSLTPAEADKLKADLIAKVADSTKVAMPTSPGVTAGRHVTTRLIVDALTEGKDGLTQKVQLNGITSDGKCPLFDLNAKATLSEAHKDKPADVDEVRAAAVAQVFQKLETEAPTLKPAASCSGDKNKKK